MKPTLKMTPAALLDATIKEGPYIKSLRDMFNEYVVHDGGLGDDTDTEMSLIAKNIINAVLKDVAQAADGFGGDATDFSAWIAAQIKEPQ